MAVAHDATASPRVRHGSSSQRLCRAPVSAGVCSYFRPLPLSLSSSLSTLRRARAQAETNHRWAWAGWTASARGCVWAKLALWRQVLGCSFPGGFLPKIERNALRRDDGADSDERTVQTEADRQVSENNGENPDERCVWHRGSDMVLQGHARRQLRENGGVGDRREDVPEERSSKHTPEAVLEDVDVASAKLPREGTDEREEDAHGPERAARGERNEVRQDRRDGRESPRREPPGRQALGDEVRRARSCNDAPERPGEGQDDDRLDDAPCP